MYCNAWSTDLDGVIPNVIFTLQLQLFASDLPLNQSEYTADTLSSNQNRVDHTGIRRDGHLLLEVEMYLQKGCIMLSGVGSS